MKIDIDRTIPISKINQNFSEATSITDEKGIMIIMKNNKQKFVIMTFENFETIKAERRTK